MKRVLLRSVFEAFEYVKDHYYPFGFEDMAQRKDSYAVISIQNTHGGLRFRVHREQELPGRADAPF